LFRFDRDDVSSIITMGHEEISSLSTRREHLELDLIFVDDSVMADFSKALEGDLG